jgi:hypothetical protein
MEHKLIYSPKTQTRVGVEVRYHNLYALALKRQTQLSGRRTDAVTVNNMRIVPIKNLRNSGGRKCAVQPYATKNRYGV